MFPDASRAGWCGTNPRKPIYTSPAGATRARLAHRLRGRADRLDLADRTNTDRRAKAVAAWRKVGGQRGAELRKDHTRARDYLLEAATENTKLPEDAVAIMMATQKWQGIERMVAAGATLRDTIAATSDIPTLLAVAEFGPAFAAASSYREPHPQERVGFALDGVRHDPTAGGAWVQRAVWARLAEVTPDDKLRTLLAGALNADQQLNAAEPWFDVSDSMAAGSWQRRRHGRSLHRLAHRRIRRRLRHRGRGTRSLTTDSGVA